MPAFSGLWDAVHGDGPYAPTATPSPPVAGGIMRVMMQKRGLYGLARGIGLPGPATVKGVGAELPTLTVRGGYDYANRQDDAANTVDIVHGGGDVNVLEDITMPADMPPEMVEKFVATTLNSEYAADEADNGATAEAWSGAIAT